MFSFRAVAPGEAFGAARSALPWTCSRRRTKCTAGCRRNVITIFVVILVMSFMVSPAILCSRLVLSIVFNAPIKAIRSSAAIHIR